MVLLIGALFIVFALWMTSIFVRKILSTAAPYEEHLQTALQTKYRYRRREFFMTKRESDCYKALMQAVGNEYFIFPQAPLTTVLDEKIKYENWRAARAHIDRKSVDFVLCDKELISPKLAIELDDWSHERIDRQERDREVERILKSIGMPLLRITTTEDLRDKVFKKISEKV